MILNERCTGWDLLAAAFAVALCISSPLIGNLTLHLIMLLALVMLFTIPAILIARVAFGNAGALVITALCIIITLAGIHNLITGPVNGVLP